MNETVPKFDANNEQDHLAQEAHELLSTTIWRTTELPAVVDKILEVTQVESPKDLEIRRNLVNKLTDIVRAKHPERYEKYLEELKTFLKNITQE